MHTRFPLIKGIGVLTWMIAFCLIGFLYPAKLQAAQTASAEATVNQAAAEATPVSEPLRGLTYDHLRGATKGSCAGMYEIVGTSYCTHGPDLPPPGVDSRKSVSPIILAADAAPATVICEGDGESGNRVQVLYVRASDQPDRFAQFQQSIQQWAVDVDEIYNASALETGHTRHIRFVHDANCQVKVLNVTIPPNATATFAESISGLQALGHNRKDRKYLMFVDSTVFCGIGGMYSDENPSDSNRNNGGPTYARVDSGCWGARVAAHELMHNFGGVQFGAPNASGGYHCTDDWDIMCYSDAPKYPQVTIKCADPANEHRLDCNHDDYYHTNPPAGSYLATNWNPAFNQFLIWENQPTPTPTFTPTPTPPVSPNCINYRASEIPVSIYDLQTAAATLNVPDNFVLSRVKLVNLQIQHTFVADLDAYLVSPKGTKVLLFHGVGLSERDFAGTWLADDASAVINDGIAPFTGSYRPAVPLSTFEGENASGRWQLQITDTAFRDAGILNAWGLELCREFSPEETPTPDGTDPSTPEPTPIDGEDVPTPTATPVPPRESSAQLEIVLDVDPKSIANFRFEINGQMIVLDDAETGDDDPYTNRFVAILTTGNYQIREWVPNTWFLKSIDCTVDATIHLDSEEPAVTVQLSAGERVSCTFHNERNVVIRSQVYEDLSQNMLLDSDEPGLVGEQVLLYAADGTLLDSKASNEFGKANFNGLPAGSYTICQAISENWLPSTLYGRSVNSDSLNQICYDASLTPGQIAVARFGNVKREDAAAVFAQHAVGMNDGLDISQLPDVADDYAGYGDEITQDTDANTPIFQATVFLPFVTR